MYKYIIGAVVAVGLLVAGSVYGYTVGFQIVDSVPVDGGVVTKIYDDHNGVVCYTFKAGSFGTEYKTGVSGSLGISCLKNN